MPLWIHVFTPWVMAVYIFAALTVNFGMLCAASTCTREKVGGVRFALDRLMGTFLCAAVSCVVGFAIMAGMTTLGTDRIKESLMQADYYEMNAFWVPLFACTVSAVLMYNLTKYVILRRSIPDKMTRTMLSGCFALLNTPYILLIPILK